MSFQQLDDQLNKILAASSRQSEHECLVDILIKKNKTQEETKMLFNKIKSFNFFKNFFAHYIQDMDMHSIFNICQGFSYEKIQANRTVFSQKDPSNDKFYVILSGEVAVCIKNENDQINAEKDKRSASPVFRRQKKMSTYSAKNPETPLVRRRSKRLSSQPLSNVSSDKIHPDESPKLSPTSRTSIPKKSIFGRRDAQDSEIDAPHLRHFTMNPPSPTRRRGDYSPESHDESRLLPSVLKVGKRFSFIDHNNHRRMNIIVDQIANVRAVRNQSIEPHTLASNFNTNSLQYLDHKDRDDRDGNYDDRHGSIKMEDTDFSSDDETPKSDFEIMVLSLGKLVRYLREGEGFGEIALKRNIPRTASILCKKDCEFLTLSKEQYELGFGKMQREKEDFIHSIFPMLKNITFSIDILNSLLYSFKTERYPRGHCIINEGNVTPKEAKFYIIQQGECLIEKQIYKDDNEPLNSNKKLMGCVNKATITVSGKGVIVGEEILLTKTEYKYSVKASSEILVVQAITLKDFKHKFPKEVREHVQDLYEQKKVYREAVYEQIKKDNEQKLAQYKADTTYSLQNREIKEYVIKSALGGFNKRMPKSTSTKTFEDSHGLVDVLVSPKRSQFDFLMRDNGTGTNYFGENKPMTTNGLEIRSNKSEDLFPKEKEEKELYSWFGKLTNLKQNKIFAKMEFLSRIPDPDIDKNRKTTEDDSLFRHIQKKEKPVGKFKMVSPRLHKKPFKEPAEVFTENPDTPTYLPPKRKSSNQPLPLKINNYGERLSLESDRGELDPDYLQPLDLRRKTLGTFRFKQSDTALLNKQFNSPPQIQSARTTESASHSRKISHSEFKSLYCQTLVKGTSHIKGLSMTASTSSTLSTMKRVATEAQLPQKVISTKADSLRKNLLLTKFNTEPDTESRNDSGLMNSFSIKSSSRRDSGSAESSNDSKPQSRLPSQNDIPIASPKSVKRSAFANDADKKDTVVFSPALRKKSPLKGNSDSSDTRLHQVQEWRKKVFKKTAK